jgi:hypothetical protein
MDMKLDMFLNATVHNQGMLYVSLLLNGAQDKQIDCFNLGELHSLKSICTGTLLLISKGIHYNLLMTEF